MTTTRNHRPEPAWAPAARATVHTPKRKTPRELSAELRVLELFDRRRAIYGHDYGNGQRAKELLRRERELEELAAGVAGHDALRELAPRMKPQELADAFERVGRPRLRRIEATIARYVHGTPAMRRTRDAWQDVELALVLRPARRGELS